MPVRHDLRSYEDKSGCLPQNKQPGQLWYGVEKQFLVAGSSFARKYGIPKRTFEGWEMGERVPAPYLRDLLARVAKEDYPERWEEFEKEIKD